MISLYAVTASAITAHTAFGLQSAKTSPDGPYTLRNGNYIVQAAAKLPLVTFDA